MKQAALFAKVNGISINYRTAGRGEPLVLIMGLSGEQSAWASQVQFFKRRYRVITFDNRGVGKSDKPPGPYTTKMMADDTVGLMDHLGIEKANIMGVSMGGMIAQEVAINYPERVMKLVLASTYSCQDNGPNGATEEMASAGKLSYERAIATLANLTFNKPLIRFLINLQIRIGSIFAGGSAKALGRAGVMSQTEACVKHNAIERLPSIQSPTLVITGTNDRVIKSTSSDMLSQRIPSAKLVKIENGSHACCMEMKDIFNREVLNFLTEST